MTQNTWNCGTLREDYSRLKKGTVVFYRRVTTSRQRAVGPCYWIRPQGLDHYWQIAESFGGPGMRDLIHPKRDKFGALLESPPEATKKLEDRLRKFLVSLPAGARPNPPGTKPRTTLKDNIKL